MSADDIIVILAVLAFVLFLIVVGGLNCPQPTERFSIGVRFPPQRPQRRSFRWRFWRRAVDTIIPVGGNKVGEAYVLDSDGNEVVGALFDSPVQFLSSDESIFTASNADDTHVNATAVAEGSAQLLTQATYLQQSIQGSATVTVTAIVGGFTIGVRWND